MSQEKQVIESLMDNKKKSIAKIDISDKALKALEEIGKKTGNKKEVVAATILETYAPVVLGAGKKNDATGSGAGDSGTPFDNQKY